MEKIMWEKHHVRPISMYGKDIAENLMILDHNNHTNLHKKMDVSSKFIRETREKLNSVLIYEPKHIEIIAGLQRRFFDNLHRLPVDIQKKHLDWVKQYYNNERYNFDKLIEPLKDNNYGLTVPDPKRIRQNSFDIWFDNLIALEKANSYAQIQIIRLKAIKTYENNNYNNNHHNNNHTNTKH